MKMPITVRRAQPLSYYQSKYHIPILSEAFPTIFHEIRKTQWERTHDGGKLGLFSSVHLETFNRCNNDCPFCSANRNRDKRRPTFMKEELFEIIVSQLSRLAYSGRIELFNNNEPLLDKRLSEFLRIINQRIPKARTAIWTNGILLNKKILEEFHSNGLRELVIDDYSDDCRISSHIEALVNEIDNTCIAMDMDVLVWTRKKNVVLINRGGNSPNKENESYSDIDRRLVKCRWCSLPFHQFVVHPDGLVSICCSDVLGEHIVGDLNSESVIDIWNGEKFKFVRNELNANGRRNIIPCNRCDSIV